MPLDELETQRLVRATGNHAVAHAIVGEHRCRHADVRDVEVVLVRHFHGRAKDRFQLQVAPIALRRFLAELEDGMALDAFGFGHARILEACISIDFTEIMDWEPG